MAPKKTTAQRVAELTPKQKKNVMWIGTCSIIITLIAIAVTVFIFLQAYNLYTAAEEAKEDYEDVKAEKGILNAHEELEEWGDAEDAMKAYSDVLFTYGICLIGIGIVWLVSQLLLFPYYKDRFFYYMLFHKEARS